MYLSLPAELLGSFIYVDCGSQGDRTKSLLSIFANSRYIGFDPEQSIRLEKESSNVYFPVAVGKKTQLTKFYRTQNRNCSSLYIPNQELLKNFMQVDEFCRVEEIVQLNTVMLDTYLPHNGITEIDFMELDTQGSELDILQGAESFLSSSILGVRVEVEFFPIYSNQPLFAEIDSYLRKFGFMLFDLERYHLRRKSLRTSIKSREQIAWGQALYFRDFRSLPSDLVVTKQQLCKLAMIASYYGFHSYAFEIINSLVEDSDLLTTLEKKDLQDSLTQYLSVLENNSVEDWMRFLDNSVFRKIFRWWWSVFARLYEAYQFVASRQNYSWKD